LALRPLPSYRVQNGQQYIIVISFTLANGGRARRSRS
jgi:hypothetical protein